MKKQESSESILSQLDPEQIKEVASGVADGISSFIRKHPFESVGAAMLVGLVAGLLIKGKK